MGSLTGPGRGFSRRGGTSTPAALRRGQPLQLLRRLGARQRGVEHDRQVRAGWDAQLGRLHVQPADDGMHHLLLELASGLDVPPLPQLGELRAELPRLLDHGPEPLVVRVLRAGRPELGHHLAGHLLPVRGAGPVDGVGEEGDQTVLHDLRAHAEDQRGRVVVQHRVPVPVHDVRGERHPGVDQPPQPLAHVPVGRGDLEGGRIEPGEHVQVPQFGAAELQHPAHRVQYLRGHRDVAALFQPLVPGGPDSGEHRDLLPAQARGAAAGPAVRQAGLGRGDPGASAHEELAEFGPAVRFGRCDHEIPLFGCLVVPPTG